MPFPPILKKHFGHVIHSSVYVYFPVNIWAICSCAHKYCLEQASWPAWHILLAVTGAKLWQDELGSLGDLQEGSIEGLGPSATTCAKLWGSQSFLLWSASVPTAYWKPSFPLTPFPTRLPASVLAQAFDSPEQPSIQWVLGHPPARRGTRALQRPLVCWRTPT